MPFLSTYVLTPDHPPHPFSSPRCASHGWLLLILQALAQIRDPLWPITAPHPPISNLISSPSLLSSWKSSTEIILSVCLLFYCFLSPTSSMKADTDYQSRATHGAWPLAGHNKHCWNKSKNFIFIFSTYIVLIIMSGTVLKIFQLLTFLIFIIVLWCWNLYYLYLTNYEAEVLDG